MPPACYLAPVRATLAWVDHHTLPYPGGVNDQPYNLWRAMEEVAKGLNATRSSLAKIRTDELLKSIRR
jgi:hypothetical protein